MLEYYTIYLNQKDKLLTKYILFGEIILLSDLYSLFSAENRVLY